MKNILIAGIVVVIAGIGVYFLMKPAEPSATMSPSPTATVTSSASPTSTAQARTITVVGSDFSFDTSTITVNKGDTVTIIFKNTDGIHDWVVDEFNARTSRIGVGKSAAVTFVANKTGSFEYYCSVGNHRQMGMRGTLIVK